MPMPSQVACHQALGKVRSWWKRVQLAEVQEGEREELAGMRPVPTIPICWVSSSRATGYWTLGI